MNPEQPGVPAPGNNYDFIINSSKPPKTKVRGGIGGNAFIVKLAFIVGGALLVMIVLAVAVNLFLGSKTSLGNLVTIAQSEQEILRLGEQSKNASDQTVKNAATNTQLSIRSQQQTWLAFMQKRGRTVKPEELALKKNLTTDKTLKAAVQTSTFDTAYTTVMRSQLEAYAGLLKSAYNGATNKKERDLLNSHYGAVQLLLQQWPK